MPHIEVFNDYVRIHAPEDDEGVRLIKRLDHRTAYSIAGAEFVPSYKDGFWDGKVHLLKATGDYYRMPTGLLDAVLGVFPHLEIRDHRKRPLGDRCRFRWIGHTLRDYQQEAVESALGPTLTGEPPRGILQVPIRGGKTLIAARLIHSLGWRTTFVVESELLLRQTVKAFKEYMEPVDYVHQTPTEIRPISYTGPWVGSCGSGSWHPGWITVVMVQTMLARPVEALALLRQTDLVIVDEVHHMKADEWRKPLLSSDIWGRIGLSATLFEDPSIPQERSAVWVRAVVGPTICQIPVSRLIDAGYLVQPWVLMYPVYHVGARRTWRGGATYNECVVDSVKRNSLICDLTQDAVARGALVLIDTGRLNQMGALRRMLEARGVACEEIHGKTPSDRRQRILTKFRKRHVQVLIGTILGEGVDVPELEVVINAEGGKSRVAVMQRLRNLTVSDGKQHAVVIDFADIGQPHLQDHSLDRLDQYVGTEGFRVRAMGTFDGPASIPDDIYPPAEVLND